MMAATKWLTSLGAGCCIAGLLTGCTLPPPPDPNEPLEGRPASPKSFMLPLRRLSDGLNERIAKGEITDQQAKEIISNYADRVLDGVDLKSIDPAQAWEYGDLYRTARRWNEAKNLLQIAVNHARKTRNDDRRVNDSLRLAHVLASLGEVANAVEIARSTFDVPDEGAAPILMAVLLEIVPAGEGKGRDVELAKLLEGAIAQHLRTVVDPRTDAGQAFEIARWHHIGNAWKKILELYERANRPDLLEEARKRAASMLQSFQRA